MQQIEDIVDEAVTLSCLERRLKPRKAREAVLVLHYDLAVDQRPARGKLCDDSGDIGKFAGPVEAFAGEQADLAMVEPRLDAIAVELDLMDPAFAARRDRTQGRKGRRDEIRQWRPVRTGLFVLPFALCAALLRPFGCCRPRAARPRARRFDRARSRPAAAGRASPHIVFDAPVRMPDAFAALTLGNFRDRAAADHRERLVLENVGIFRVPRRLVPALDQEPRLLLFPGAAMHAHEMPTPAQLLALEPEVEVAFLEAGMRVAFRIPATAIPDHHGAAAVLSLRDRPLEGVVLERVIFHVD